ncbi:Eyes absent 3 [Phytophthora pseudosyringae]|uniref:Eyes absent 3 n=1 Tax=Phytophthora pseudosyringae TaxID=221518 RepID=A0A8T1W2L7_9STRA|nr:Eyes absent 3 [Phytophthora pseudosyringae]
MEGDASCTVRVCLTRCPLPPAEENVHSLPCRIHFDGSAAVKTFFRPQSGDCNSNSTDHGGPGTEEQDVTAETEHKSGNAKLHAEFRGIQLQGEKLPLAPLGFTGLVLEDSGMRHPEDEGRVWEVEDHFDELTWWDVPNHMTSETQQLPLVLQQWRDLASAIHDA